MSSDNLAQQAADLFLKAAGDHPGFRLAHAKGLVCEGVFEPTKAAAELSRAAQFKAPVPLILRFSNSTGLPMIPDGDPNANTRGMAIRFVLPGGGIADIVANGLRGFVTSTPAEFVAFLGAALSSGPDTPKPTPLEKYLGAHPVTLAHVTKPNPTPVSFAAKAYFGNNALIFVNRDGQKVATRYEILPAAGEQNLDAATAAAKPPNFLMDDLKARVAKGPVEFKLWVQVANPGDPTSDVNIQWPADRKRVELGTIRVTSVDPYSAETEKKLTFDPNHITDGIELSDDPILKFRAEVYSLSIARRMAAK